jgi:tRNA (adenine22-N1)-methyltransferase
LKLSERLQAIANLVDDNVILADIGTDHGYIPVYLLNNKKIKYVVAADINKGPLENAKKEILVNNLQNKVDLRLGSGLSVLKIGEVDEAIIAGMGGVLISEILEDSFEIAKDLKKIILQPMQASDELRKYLYNKGFEIIDEVLVKEDFRIYEIIIVRYKGKVSEVEDNIYYEVGKKVIEKRDPLVLEFIGKKINECKKIIQKIEGKEGEKIENKIKECNYKIQKLKELKSYVC